MDSYKTIEKPVVTQFEEKKSRFIGQLFPVQSEKEALACIASVKEQNREAKHNVYAYRVRENNLVRFSDDGEPAGTAGKPILEVLVHEELTDVALVVTRYFGGILLGTGGLVRAYSQSASDAVHTAKILEMKPAIEFLLETNYTLYGRIQTLFGEYGAIVKDSIFGEGITLDVLMQSACYDSFCRQLSEISAGKLQPIIKNECYHPF